MSSHMIALVALVGASLLGGSAGVVAKILLRTFPPFPLAFVRFAIATVVILPFFLSQKRPKPHQWLKETIPIALASTLNITFFYLGLTRTTANASVIIYTATPLVVSILATVFLKENVTQRKLVGIVLGFIGVLTIVVAPLMEMGEKLSGDFWGNVLVVMAMLCWSLYTVGSRFLISQRGYSPVFITSVSIFFTACFFGLATHFIFPVNYLTPLTDSHTFLLMVYLAVMVTVVMYFLYQWAIKHSSATTASLSTYLQPVFAISLGIIILGERLTLGFVVGGFLVIAGVFLATGTQVARQVSLLRRYLK